MVHVQSNTVTYIQFSWLNLKFSIEESFFFQLLLMQFTNLLLDCSGLTPLPKKMQFNPWNRVCFYSFLSGNNLVNCISVSA